MKRKTKEDLERGCTRGLSRKMNKVDAMIVVNGGR